MIAQEREKLYLLEAFLSDPEVTKASLQVLARIRLGSSDITIRPFADGCPSLTEADTLPDV